MKKRTLVILCVFLFFIACLVVYRFYKMSIPPVVTLEETVTKALVGAQGEYGIVVKHFTAKEAYQFNGSKIYPTGSLYKLWIMAAVFDQIERGQLKEEEELSSSITDLNQKFDIATDSAELTEGFITLTVQDALKQMITISHNYAALLLSDKIGLSKVAAFLEKNKLAESKLGLSTGLPQTTTNDIVMFLEKLYKRELANKSNTDKMLTLLKKQQLNNKLPKYLPKGTVVAHKTGEIDYLTHDAGIVYTKHGDYIIVVLSKSDYPPGAEERIAQISKAVYDYFILRIEK